MNARCPGVSRASVSGIDRTLFGGEQARGASFSFAPDYARK
jgi:hypothetical protein